MELIAERYRLGEPLGEGGGGTVWRAVDELLHREVAVKQLRIPPGLSERELAEFTGRAIQEARAAGGLSHPAIVMIHDVVEHDRQPWIVMDLVPGRSLDKVVREGGPLPVMRVAEIGLAVLDALETAHRHGILHRDVKPGNVLLGEDGRAMLTDFGIAAPLRDQNADEQSSAGSPAYMAPERFRGEAAGPPSDLWSLGATLYAAVEGQGPFHRNLAAAVVAAVLFQEPPPLVRASPELAELIRAMLDKDPARRPTPDAIRRTLHALAVSPPPAPSGYWHTTTPPDAHWQGSTQSSGRGMSQGMSQGTPEPPADRGAPPGGLSQATTQPPPPPARRSNMAVVLVAFGAVLSVAVGAGAFVVLRGNGEKTGGASSTGSPVAGVTSPEPGSRSAGASPGASAGDAALNADVCAMLDPAAADRLVPGAKISSRSNDNRGDSLVSYVRWTCEWVNRNISYKDVNRSRQITVNLARYEAIGNTTADKSARIQYNGTLSQYKFGVKTSTKERYYSTPIELTGIGDEAAVHYQWVHDKNYRYAFGEGVGRVGNVVFDVKYEADQQHKEADIFSTDTTKSITEENATREVKGLLSQLAQSVTAWQQGRPMPFHARPTGSPSPSPSPTPTMIALPPVCVGVRPLAAKLVPKTAGAAAKSKEGRAQVTQCQWWNDKLPAGTGKIRWRNLRVSIHTFTDADSARYFLIDKRGKNKFTAGSSIGGIRWSRMHKLPGLGQDGFGQAIRQRTETAQSNRYEIYVLDGKNVVWILFGGSDRPADTPINSTESTLMNMKEATEGARSMAEAIVKAL